MKRQLLAIVLVFCMLLGISSVSANAANAEPQTAASQGIYVRSTGDDANDGTKEAPFATLKKAVEAAQDDATIYVMDSLTMTECARFYNKNLTITSADPSSSVTITRGDDFKTLSDTARSWYHPAMIEVQGTEGTCGLTLTNIVLDDAGKHMGTVFAQAVSGVTEEDKSNQAYVQDAMIASNAVVPCTITLGEGSVLRNFGGMSAIRVTDQAQVVLKSGSVI